MKTMQERLKSAIAEKDISASELSRRIGITRGAVSHWLTETSQSVDGKNLVKAAAELGVRPEWLATGKGHRYPDDVISTSINSLIAEPLPQYSDRHIDALEAIKQLAETLSVEDNIEATRALNELLSNKLIANKKRQKK